jgi:hypothetical protein
MKLKALLFSLLLLFGLFRFTAFSQSFPAVPDREPAALTPQQLYSLSTLPPLTVPEKYKGSDAPLLPWWIDNSTQPYFRSITFQTGFECGQSAGISFNFTYEVDRLRDVAADTTTTQYPSHFTWNFLNNGEKYGGASCFDSWEILRTCGNMNVADYGGDLGTGGYLRWISGYDYYYNGMFNRINFMRSIRVDSPEGLQTLKYWLTDHLEGSEVGGVANLYGKYFHLPPETVLPEGTPESGKYVQTHWGPSATHTFTVVGYNDSIRYDFNGDGQYTNNIDINIDGVVDMHDWEIGGLKLASAFDGIPWCDQGFVYTMYKNLADDIGYGGIWNHSVYVIDTKETCIPKLTAKIVLKHTSRNKLKVTMGISTDLQATEPSYVLEYPIFKFQGGDHYMQGDTTEAAKTIEFGLDLAPLINQLNNGQTAQFFLQVEEKDPNNESEGRIISYSLIDYSFGFPIPVICSLSNVPIVNNTTTRLKINHSVTVPRPAITTTALPDGDLYQPYSYQLSASGGSGPYVWDASIEYPETTTSATFPAISGQKLELANTNSGYAIVNLPFDFPFYKKLVKNLYVYADGYITFDDQPFSWPYLIDKMLLFKYTSIISPFMCDMNLYPNQSDGIWYQQDPFSVTIFWKASLYYMPGTSSLDFAVKLFNDGKIEFYYGTMNYPGYASWIGGISGGDNQNYQLSLLNNSSVIPANTLDRFSPSGFPPGMSVTEDGLFTGIPSFPCQNCPVTFQVMDNNNISSKKTLLFSTQGLSIIYMAHSGADTILEYGDTVSFDIFAANLGSHQIHNSSFTLRPDNAFSTVIDSTELTGDFGASQAKILTDAFTFVISPVVPDGDTLFFQLIVASDEQNFRKEIYIVAHAPVILLKDIAVEDGDNGRLDPGETSDILLTFKNMGSAEAFNTNVFLSPADPYLSINSKGYALGDIKPDSAKSIICNVTAAGDAPFQHLYSIRNYITTDEGYSAIDTGYFYSGDIVEDFESGNYKKFDWYLGGNGLFYVDSLVNHEGRFCTRSGWIYDGQESSLNINLNVLQSGTFSFYRQISCEHDPGGSCSKDYLAFYIDEKEMGRWDGWSGWTLQAYEVEKGYHTFRWLYHKDWSTVGGSDCAWIDFITFPPFSRAFPEIGVNPESLVKDLQIGKTSSDTLFISNTGGGILDFSIEIIDTIPVRNTWLTVDPMNGSVFMKEPDTLLINWDAHNLDTGFYQCSIVITDSLRNSILIPVTLHVLDTNNNMIQDKERKILITSYPNPFSLSVQIEYDIQKPGLVKARVYDLQGKTVRSLISENMPAGRYKLIWNGKNDHGENVSPGMYYYTMQTEDMTGTIKLVLIR